MDEHIRSVKLPVCESIGSEAFDSCLELCEIYAPNVASVGKGAFGNAALEKISLPNVTSLGDSAFAWCLKLREVDLPKITSIPYNAFGHCVSLSRIDLPNVTSIGVLAFESTSLQTVELPLVTVIEDNAFSNCINLKKVDLGNATSICLFAFANCRALKDVILRTTSTVCVCDRAAFPGTPIEEGRGHIYVPTIMYEYYRAAYEAALGAEACNVLFRKIEDYPEICG
jgi:hypothetical protein